MYSYKVNQGKNINRKGIMKIHNSCCYCFAIGETIESELKYNLMLWNEALNCFTIGETVKPRVVYLHSQDVSPRGFSRDH